MNCQPKEFTVQQIVDAWNDASLKRNEEYQRGAEWKAHQQQGLVDSIFRKYPIPPLFLHEIKSKGLSGQATRHEIVDGQQRILALVDYLADKYPLLKPKDEKLRLPNSLRSEPAPWGNLRFSELNAAMQNQLTQRKLDVFVITNVAHEDEIRDLFIRLQAGTALSRQQIRDAWPGNIGPYIVKLAGKMDTTPAIELFKLVDRRGDRSEDDECDDCETDRQFCAQLLCLFLARESDPCATQSVGANDLDKLYHENPVGEFALKFETVLKRTTKVCTLALEMGVEDQRGRRRKRFSKLNLISAFLFIQDLSKNSSFRFDHAVYENVAPHLFATQHSNNRAKATVGRTINEYYGQWREKIDPEIGIRLDPKRLFDPEQKKLIYDRDGGKCGICLEPVEEGEDEYDHFPVAHKDGGKTNVENGRLVHRKHHPRPGRPLSQDDEV